MGTKTCIPTSQRPIIASKFYQKATAANLLVQPNIKQGFGKKQRAAAASCQPHIGLISSNQLKWKRLQESSSLMLGRRVCSSDSCTSKTLPFFCHNATEPGNSLKSRRHGPPFLLHAHHMQEMTIEKLKSPLKFSYMVLPHRAQD